MLPPAPPLMTGDNGGGWLMSGDRRNRSCPRNPGPKRDWKRGCHDNLSQRAALLQHHGEMQSGQGRNPRQVRRMFHCADVRWRHAAAWADRQTVARKAKAAPSLAGAASWRAAAMAVGLRDPEPIASWSVLAGLVWWS